MANHKVKIGIRDSNKYRKTETGIQKGLLYQENKLQHLFILLIFQEF